MFIVSYEYNTQEYTGEAGLIRGFARFSTYEDALADYNFKRNVDVTHRAENVQLSEVIEPTAQ